MTDPSLADILGTVSLDTIREHLESRAILHVPSPGIDVAVLFSLADLEALLAAELEANDDLRVTLKGAPVDLARMGALDGKGRVRPLALQKLLRQGASVIVNNAERRVPRLWALAARIGAATGARCTIGVIASFSEMVALPVHYDRQDLILIQLDGAKHWRFLGEPFAGSGMPPPPGFDPPEEVVRTANMRAGDLMFVPSGQHHQCTSDGWSLHLGILLHHPTGLDLMGDIFAQAHDLRIPFPTLEGADARAARQAAFRARLIEAVQAADIDGWLERWSAGVAKPSALSLRPGDSRAEDARVTLVVRPARRPDGKWEVGGASFALSPAAVTIIAAMSSGSCAPSVLVAATGLADDELHAALKQLVREGVVRID